MIFRVADVQQMEDILKENALTTVGGEALGIA